MLEQVHFREVSPTEPSATRPLTPEAVRQLLADRAVPEERLQWIREHLASRADDGSFVPRSAAEISATMGRLADEASQSVANRVGEPVGEAARTDGPDAQRPHTDPPQPEQLVEQRGPSENFSREITRTGADLPAQVHELVDRAKENLLARYPEHVVEGRIRDLEGLADRADALQAAADRSRGDAAAVVRHVRELSAAVQEYADRYRDWRDFSRGGEHADPGWRDIDGIDPLDSVEMAHRAVGVDPSTHQFHVIDQAIAVAKIGDVLGAEFEAQALRSFEHTVPKDVESVRALRPDLELSPEMVAWIEGSALGGFHPESGTTFVEPRSGGGPRPLSAFAATILHESLHPLQPRRDLVNIIHLRSPDRHLINAHLIFEREFQAFAVQQRFVQGLAGFRLADHAGDMRIPRTDQLAAMANWTPREIENFVRDSYLSREQNALLGPDVLRRFPDLTVDRTIDQARSAIIDSTHPLVSERLQGNLYGPLIERMATHHGLDLAEVQRQQTEAAGRPPDIEPPGRGTRDSDLFISEERQRPQPNFMRRIFDKISSFLVAPDDNTVAGRETAESTEAPTRAEAPTRTQPESWLGDRRAAPPAGHVIGGRTGAAGVEGVHSTRTYMESRLGERGDLLVEFNDATTASERIRLREAIESVDQDLRNLGHPVERLDPIPDHHAVEPVRPPDHSTHAEIWEGRPWEAEGRRVSLDEAIPSSAEEIARYEPIIREVMAREFDGREFGGLRLRVDLSDPQSVTLHPGEIVLRAHVVQPDRGSVGRIVEVFRREEDGSLTMQRSILSLHDSVQGQGFGRGWNGFVEDWARYSGVARMDVHASWGVGGYVWARLGFDWMPGSEHRALNVLRELRVEIRKVDGHIAEVGRWVAGDESVDIGRLRQRYGFDDPDSLVAEMRRQADEGRLIVARAAQIPFGHANYPTPHEIIRAGWNGQHGREATWLGKETLLDSSTRGTDWYGVLNLSEDGPRFPRSAHLAADAQLPPPSAVRDALSNMDFELARPPDFDPRPVSMHILDAAARAEVPRSELDVLLTRTPSGERLVRIFSDEAFLSAVRQWDPDAHGGQARLFDGALAPELIHDAIPGLRDLAGGSALAAGEPLRFEVRMSSEIAGVREAAGDVWLHRRDDLSADPGLTPMDGPPVDASPPRGDSRIGPGDVPLRLDENGNIRPLDRSGHMVRDHEIEFINHDQPATPFDQPAIGRWARGEMPLGMPPHRWQEWNTSLREALIADGVDPVAVDVRMKGSAAEFFSGVRKSMPTVETLAADLATGRISREVHDSALATIRDWQTRGGEVPVARPFDTMYRLGLDPERSDFDLNFSSDSMFRRGLQRWDDALFTKPDGERQVPVNPGNHGYLNKAVVRAEFPHLREWADYWTRELGREMSYAVFLSRGPDITTLRPGHAGISVHFRDTDMIIKRAGEP